jgi:hypothetical protein
VILEEYSIEARPVIFFARMEAGRFGSDSIEPRHLLLGLLTTVNSEMASVLSQHGIKREAVFALLNYEIPLILSAAHYAAEKHANHRRKGAAAEPYLNHLTEVAHPVSTALSEPDATPLCFTT